MAVPHFDDNEREPGNSETQDGAGLFEAVFSAEQRKAPDLAMLYRILNNHDMEPDQKPLALLLGLLKQNGTLGTLGETADSEIIRKLFEAKDAVAKQWAEDPQFITQLQHDSATYNDVAILATLVDLSDLTNAHDVIIYQADAIARMAILTETGAIK